MLLRQVTPSCKYNKLVVLGETQESIDALFSSQSVFKFLADEAASI